MIEMKNTPFDIPIFDLTGKVAVITGSTTGLGYGMAVAFCAYGAKVVINGLEWTARSSDDTIIFRTGDVVTVVGIEGVKLIVEGQKKGD